MTLDEAIEAAASASCSASLADNHGKLIPCGFPACDCDRKFIREQERVSLAAFLRGFTPDKAMIGAGFMAIPEWDTLDHVVAVAKIWAAMAGKLADQLCPDQPHGEKA